jgi:hypothetical protein
MIVASTLAVTALALWISVNIATTEKRLTYWPRRLYTSQDVDFRRSLAILLGPPLVGGNHLTTLIDGARIYPAVLAAIHAATPNRSIRSEHIPAASPMDPSSEERPGGGVMKPLTRQPPHHRASALRWAQFLSKSSVRCQCSTALPSGRPSRSHSA